MVKGTPDRGMTFSDVYKAASMSQGGPPTASASVPMQGTTLQYSLPKLLRLRSIQTLARSRWWT